MDAQMKRGFLEACVLATLQRRESYGYQIIKDVPASLGLTESSLYPLLKRLQGAGMIAVRTSEHNGRLRKYYRITTTGQERLVAFLAEQDEIRGLYRYVEESMGASVAAASLDAPCSAATVGAQHGAQPASTSVPPAQHGARPAPSDVPSAPCGNRLAPSDAPSAQRGGCLASPGAASSAGFAPSGVVTPA